MVVHNHDSVVEQVAFDVVVDVVVDIHVLASVVLVGNGNIAGVLEQAEPDPGLGLGCTRFHSGKLEIEEGGT